MPCIDTDSKLHCNNPFWTSIVKCVFYQYAHLLLLLFHNKKKKSTLVEITSLKHFLQYKMCLLCIKYEFVLLFIHNIMQIYCLSILGLISSWLSLHLKKRQYFFLVCSTWKKKVFLTFYIMVWICYDNALSKSITQLLSSNNDPLPIDNASYIATTRT